MGGGASASEGPDGADLPRAELRETAGAFIDGLLSGVERKTGWLMAEQAGLERPYRMQSLLGRSLWSADALRDIVRGYVLEALGDADGVLVVDETGFVKKGEHSVGVARQYSGAAGRIENSQVGVFLAYASRFGQALIDRRLYLPEGWASDAERRAKAHVPEEIAFATKIEMARDLIASALDAGAPCRCVLADALVRRRSSLRRMLEERRQPYVLAVGVQPACAHDRTREGLRPDRSEAGAADLPRQRLDDASRRAKARRACGFTTGRGIALPWPSTRRFERWLLIRRNRKDAERLRLLFRLRAAEARARRTRRRSRLALDDRGMFRARQERSRPRSLRSALLARLASPHDARHGRRRLPRQAGRRPQAIGFRRSERDARGERRGRVIATKSPVLAVPGARAFHGRLLRPSRLALSPSYATVAL